MGSTTKPTFTADWFTGSALASAGSWPAHVVPRLARFTRVSWLEVGSYEGRSALWAADNIVRGLGAEVVCVDSWEDADVEGRFDANVAGRANVVKLKGRSDDLLSLICSHSFEGVYVDGSHAEEDVRRDAAEAARIVVPGGVLVFDDYDADRGHPEFGVHAAVDDFLREHPQDFEVAYSGWQLILHVRGG